MAEWRSDGAPIKMDRNLCRGGALGVQVQFRTGGELGELAAQLCAQRWVEIEAASMLMAHASERGLHSSRAMPIVQAAAVGAPVSQQ